MMCTPPYCSGDQTKEDQTARACSMYDNRNAYRVLVRRYEVTRPRRRYGNGIKTDKVAGSCEQSNEP
jgi:hypothetical protein